jgi:hypothetical protein
VEVQIVHNAHHHGGSRNDSNRAGEAIITPRALANQPKKVLETMRPRPGKRPVFIARFDKIDQDQRQIQDAQPTRVLRMIPV